MADIQDEKQRKELYRLLLTDPATRSNTSKYSFKQWENKLLGDEENLARVADYAVKKSWALDQEDFLYKYAPEAVQAPPAPKAQVAPVAPPPVEEEPYVPEPQPAIGSPEYDAQLQAQYGGMSPTLGATFGGAPAVFETKAQKKQEQISPAFKAQQLAFEDVPIAEEQRRAQRQFAKATKKQQQAALMGGPGFELQQQRADEARESTEKLKDFGSYIGATFDNMIDKAKGAERIFAAKQRALLTFGDREKKAEEEEKRVKQQIVNYVDKLDQDFAAKQADYNIEGNLFDAIRKGQWDRIPEAFAYNLAQVGIQALAAAGTGGYSMFAQVFPDMYKAGVEEIAKKTKTTPEQVIASGNDKELLSYIGGGISGYIEYLSGGILGKAMRSEGAYKFLRDKALDKIGKTKWKQAAASAAALGGVSGIEGLTEVGQGLTEVVTPQIASADTFKEARENIYKELQKPETQRRLAGEFVGGAAGGGGIAAGGRALSRALEGDFTYGDVRKATQRVDYDVVQTDNKITERNKIAQAMEEAVKANPEAEGQIRQQYQKRINEAAPTDEEVLGAYESLSVLPETEEKNTIRENLEAYMAERGIQTEPTGMDAGLGELMRREPPIVQTVNPDFPPPVAEETVTEELTPEEEDEDLAAFGREVEAIEQAAPVAPVEEAPAIAPLNIDFTKNEGRNVNYQGIEGRIKIDSDGAPYVFTKDGDVVYIEGGLSGQTPQQLGVQPLADDVISEADVETVLQDENAPLDQNQLEYDFDNNTVTLYGKPFTYEGVETNSKGQTTALRLRDANGKVKFVRNEDTILEFEIQKELYEKSRTNKPITVESATAAADQLQVVPVARIEQVPEPVQQERPVGDIEGDEVVPAEEENVIVEPDSELFQKILDNGEQVVSRLDAEKRIGDGERLFGFNEQDDSLVELSLQNLGAFPVDTIIAVRPEFIEEAPAPVTEEAPAPAFQEEEVVSAAPVEEAAPEVPAAPALKGRKRAAPVTPAPAAPKKEEAPKPSSKQERIKELEREKSALTTKALKQFPSSPAQLKTRKRIDEINAELGQLKGGEKPAEKKEGKPITLNDIRTKFGEIAYGIAKKFQEKIGEEFTDLNRVERTADRIIQLGGNDKGAAVAEALQYEIGYPDNFQDLRDAIKRGGIELNSKAVERMIEVGVELPTDIVKEFENFVDKQVEKAAPKKEGKKAEAKEEWIGKTKEQYVSDRTSEILAASENYQKKVGSKDKADQKTAAYLRDEAGKKAEQEYDKLFSEALKNKTLPNEYKPNYLLTSTEKVDKDKKRYTEAGYPQNHNEKLSREEHKEEVQGAVDNGLYAKAIEDGVLSYDEAAKIIESAGVKVPQSLTPAPSFTSSQSSEAATAFDKAKTSKGFDKKYGKGAYKALSDITKNFEDIMDKVSEKIKQDCIV